MILKREKSLKPLPTVCQYGTIDSTTTCSTAVIVESMIGLGNKVTEIANLPHD